MKVLDQKCYIHIESILIWWSLLSGKVQIIISLLIKIWQQIVLLSFKVVTEWLLQWWKMPVFLQYSPVTNIPPTTHGSPLTGHMIDSMVILIVISFIFCHHAIYNSEFFAYQIILLKLTIKTKCPRYAQRKTLGQRDFMWFVIITIQGDPT